MWKATSFFSALVYNTGRGEGMTVYADETFVLNAAVDWLLLRTAVCLTGGGAGRGRLALAAGFGGLYAALAAAFPPLASVPARVLAFFGLCLLGFGCRGPARRSWLWFFGVCCAFAGLALLTAALRRTPLLLRGGRVYYRFSGALLIGLAAALRLLCAACLRRFALHRGGELALLEAELDGKSLRCTALRDNGNTLRDPLSGRPVIVVRWRLAACILPEPVPDREAFEAPCVLMERLRLDAPRLRTCLIPYRAVGTEGGLLLAVCADRVRIDGGPAPTRLIAFSPTELSDGGAYEAVCPG